MRVLFLATYVANLILAVALLRHQPVHVSVLHGALPVVFLAALETLLLVAILLMPRLLRRFPASWLGIPNPDYWLQAENRGQAEQKIQARLLSFGTVTFLILLLAGIFVLRFQQAPLLQPEWRELRGAAIIFLAYSIYWCFGFLRDVRVPDEPRDAARDV